MTLGFKTVRDLFEKLKRDANLLDDEITSDRLFNFVVTAYSMIDWIKNDPTVPFLAKEAKDELYADMWLKITGDLATAGKHFELTSRKPIISDATKYQGYGIGRFGKGKFGEGEESIKVRLNDGKSFNCHDLVRGVLNTWQEFFDKYGI